MRINLLEKKIRNYFMRSIILRLCFILLILMYLIQCITRADKENRSKSCSRTRHQRRNIFFSRIKIIFSRSIQRNQETDFSFSLHFSFSPFLPLISMNVKRYKYRSYSLDTLKMYVCLLLWGNCEKLGADKIETNCN